MGKLHHKIASRHNSATLASPPRAGKRTRSLEPKSGCSILWPTPCALGAVDFTKGLQAAGPPWCDETQLLEAGESTLDKRPAEGKGKKKKKEQACWIFDAVNHKSHRVPVEKAGVQRATNIPTSVPPGRTADFLDSGGRAAHTGPSSVAVPQPPWGRCLQHRSR